MKSFINKKETLTVLSIALLLGLWKLLAVLFDAPYLIPDPKATLTAVFQLIMEPDFLLVAGNTVVRALVGFIFSGILGIVAGIFAGISPTFNTLITPLLVTIRSIPVISLILLALVWFQTGAVPVFIGFLTMFPFICTNVSDGIRSIDPGLIEMAHFYKVDKKRILTGVYIPAVMPFITSGASSAMGIGWRAIIIGEVLSQPVYGIGTRMQLAQTYLNVEVLIAWTLLAIALSYLFERLIRWGESYLIRWKNAS
ncbi:MAG: ABC transporter permease subunit [Bacteroidales bacterium]|jgi:NitT/TauT family transport system permease protein